MSARSAQSGSAERPRVKQQQEPRAAGDGQRVRQRGGGPRTFLSLSMTEKAIAAVSGLPPFFTEAMAADV